MDIVVENTDKFLQEHDQDGDGLIDLEEFLQVVLSPKSLPQPHQIRQAFDGHVVRGTNYITRENIRSALESLALKSNATEKAVAYFEQGALNDNQIQFEEFNQAVLSVSPMPEEQEVQRVFQAYAIAGTLLHIPNDKLEVALEELGISVTAQELAGFARTVKLNFDGRIRFSAFKYIALLPSPLEVWAKTLPLPRLLADAFPKCAGIDHLRVISTLTIEETSIVAEEVGLALKDVLRDHVSKLKRAYVDMDDLAVQAGVRPYDKFEIRQAEAGEIDHFYDGLEARIGALAPWISGMFVSRNVALLNVFVCRQDSA